ncbi:hypothetical protein RRG08_008268 [Elysia crispata]|uniref:Uncharacterized protein n=1 Tax=Elysia crispata TaxID=231223 RepID=A0AAE0ZMP8_9GAST|nr:hypothetical protein RRG08_008268 [Elysia crispata]
MDRQPVCAATDVLCFSSALLIKLDKSPSACQRPGPVAAGLVRSPGDQSANTGEDFHPETIWQENSTMVIISNGQGQSLSDF